MKILLVSGGEYDTLISLRNFVMCTCEINQTVFIYTQKLHYTTQQTLKNSAKFLSPIKSVKWSYYIIRCERLIFFNSNRETLHIVWSFTHHVWWWKLNLCSGPKMYTKALWVIFSRFSTFIAPDLLKLFPLYSGQTAHLIKCKAFQGCCVLQYFTGIAFSGNVLVYSFRNKTGCFE